MDAADLSPSPAARAGAADVLDVDDGVVDDDAEGDHEPGDIALKVAAAGRARARPRPATRESLRRDQRGPPIEGEHAQDQHQRATRRAAARVRLSIAVSMKVAGR